MLERNRGRAAQHVTRRSGTASPPRARRPRFDCLESRQLLAASLDPLPAITVPAAMGYQVPLHGGTGAGPETYAVTSSNPNVKATVAQGKFLTVNVTHASSGAADPAFQGALTFQLFDDLTPLTTSRIEQLVNQGFYTGKNFHRILAGFPGPNDYIVQGGSVNGNGTGDVNQPGFPFADEFVPQLAFTGTGQLAMANVAPNTSTNSSQFFVTTGTPAFLNNRHTIFGQLVEGQDTLIKMTQVAKDANGLPTSPVLISSAALSDTSRDGVIHVDTTHATGGQAADITVTATEPSTNTTTSQTFHVDVVGTGNTGAVRLIGRVLVVTPLPRTDNGTNTIDVTQSGGVIQVKVNSVIDATQPTVANLDRLVIYGSKANDKITVAPDVTLPATLDGGHGGKNTLQAGGGPTREHGWFGRNTLTGGPQDDALIGRAGHVRFVESGGNDVLFAGGPLHPDVSHGKGVPPSGTFYRFVRHRLVALPTPSPAPTLRLHGTSKQLIVKQLGQGG